MDIFKFRYFDENGLLTLGEPIHRIRRKTWTERYAEAGEFKFEAPLWTGLREALPIGTCVSHVDTYDVMIVENHEIYADENGVKTIVVTGRSLDVIFEGRQVNGGLTAITVDNLKRVITLAADFVHRQVVDLFQLTQVVPGENFLYFDYQTNVDDPTSESVSRQLRSGSIYERAQEFMAFEDLGLRVIRRNSFNLVGSPDNTVFLVHKGIDRTATVIFSEDTGNLINDTYLWSSKTDKNAALVESRYFTTSVLPTETGVDRKWLSVDASDLDQEYSDVPTGTTKDDILAQMVKRGEEALRINSGVNISQADVPDTAQYQFRRDYNIGDLVTIEGAYGEIETRRVTEFTEIEDENGSSGHPTLAVV